MTLQDWIAKYEKKAERFNIPPGFLLDYVPHKGFMVWRISGRVLEIYHTCTNDFAYWHDKAYEAAREAGCIKIRTNTARDPVAYMRKSKGNIRVDLSHAKDGRFYWVFEQEVLY